MLPGWEGGGIKSPATAIKHAGAHFVPDETIFLDFFDAEQPRFGKAMAADELTRHSPHCNVRADAPPHFLLRAEDDPLVAAEFSLALRSRFGKFRFKTNYTIGEDTALEFAIRSAFRWPTGPSGC